MRPPSVERHSVTLQASTSKASRRWVCTPRMHPAYFCAPAVVASRLCTQIISSVLSRRLVCDLSASHLCSQGVSSLLSGAPVCALSRLVLFRASCLELSRRPVLCSQGVSACARNASRLVLSERPVYVLRASRRCSQGVSSVLSGRFVVLSGRTVCALRASRLCSQGVSSVLSRLSGRLVSALSVLRAC